MAKKSKVEKEIQQLRKDAERLAKSEAASETVDEHEDPPLLPAKVEGIVNSVQQDLRNTPAVAAVGFFALGVIVGRLIRR